MMLVTDATAVLGLAPGRRRLGEIDIDVSPAGVRTLDGTLAGSDLALDQAVRNLVAFTGCTSIEAVATVTTDTGASAWASTTGVCSKPVGGPTSPCSTAGSASSPRSSAVSSSYLVGEEASRWKS